MDVLKLVVAPLPNKGTIGGEYLQAMILLIANVEQVASIAIDRESMGVIEKAVACSSAAKDVDELSIPSEALHSIFVPCNNHNAAAIELHTARLYKLPRAGSNAAP